MSGSRRERREERVKEEREEVERAGKRELFVRTVLMERWETVRVRGKRKRE